MNISSHPHLSRALEGDGSTSDEIRIEGVVFRSSADNAGMETATTRQSLHPPLTCGCKAAATPVSPRLGFTLLELLVVVVIIGVGTGFALPSMKDTYYKESVRGARSVAITQVARARGAAVNRGCQAWLKVANGYGGRIWVTACDGPDANNQIDTVGNVYFLSDQVQLTGSADSIPFDPTGLSSFGVTSSMKIHRPDVTTLWVFVTPVGGTYWN